MKTNTELTLKWKRLKRRLNLPRYAVSGILETLWQLTIASAPDGAIGRMSNEDIAAELEWAGDPNVLIDALRDGWLDDAPDSVGRLIVHDWSQHCPTYLKGNMANAGKKFADIALREYKTNSQVTNSEDTNSGGTNSLGLRGRAECTKSSLTKSNQVPPTPNTESAQPDAPAVADAATPDKPKTSTSKKTSGPEHPESVPIPPELDTPEFRAAWFPYIEQRGKTKKTAMTELAAKLALKQLVPFGVKWSVERIEKAIISNWSGLVFPEDAPPGSKPHLCAALKAGDYPDQPAQPAKEFTEDDLPF